MELPAQQWQIKPARQARARGCFWMRQWEVVTVAAIDRLALDGVMREREAAADEAPTEGSSSTGADAISA